MNKAKLIFNIVGVLCLGLSAVLLSFFYLKDVITIPKYTGDEYSKHVIVINISGLNKGDYEKFSSLPEISTLISTGAYSSDVGTVSPINSLTVNAALLTGSYSDKNGIANTTTFNAVDPRIDRIGYSSSSLKAPTIFDIAAKNHFKTASIMMPLTSGAKITYNLPKVELEKGEDKDSKLMSAGTPSYIVDLKMRLNKYDRGTKQPQLDSYTAKVAADTIVNRKPNLLFVNLSAIEDTRRLNGVNAQQVESALIACNNNIKEILDAINEAGIKDSTTVIIAGTNSLRDVKAEVHINNILVNNRLIADVNGSYKWRSYAEAAGELAFVRTEYEKANIPTMNIFLKAMQNPENGIYRIITRDGLDQMNVSKDIAFAIQASDGYAFSEKESETGIVYLESAEQYTSDSCSPTTDTNKSILILSGSGIKSGQIVSANIVDIAPTISRLLGLDFTGCDGAVINSAIG